MKARKLSVIQVIVAAPDQHLAQRGPFKEATDARAPPREGVIDQSSSPRRTRARMTVLYDSLPRPRRSNSAATLLRRQMRQLLQDGLQSCVTGRCSATIGVRCFLPAKLDAARLGCLQRFLGTAADHLALLLRQRGVNVQHERIDVPAQRGNDERHLLRHQAGDECDIPRQSVELGHGDGSLGLLRRLQCRL